MKEFWIYTGLRVALFLGSLAIVSGIWAVATGEVPILWAVVLAFLISGIGSYYLLARQREAFAQRVETPRPAGHREDRGDAQQGRRGLARQRFLRLSCRSIRLSDWPRIRASSGTRIFQATTPTRITARMIRNVMRSSVLAGEGRLGRA